MPDIVNSVQQRMDKMVGLPWVYMGRYVHIKGIHQSNGQVRFVTHDKPIVVETSKLPEALNDFLPYEEEEDPEVRNSAIDLFKSETDSMKQLQDIIMDNINQVKASKEYLPQAKSINDNVSTLLKINQQKIDMFRELRKAGGRR